MRLLRRQAACSVAGSNPSPRKPRGSNDSTAVSNTVRPMKAHSAGPGDHRRHARQLDDRHQHAEQEDLDHSPRPQRLQRAHQPGEADRPAAAAQRHQQLEQDAKLQQREEQRGGQHQQCRPATCPRRQRESRRRSAWSGCAGPAARSRRSGTHWRWRTGSGWPRSAAGRARAACPDDDRVRCRSAGSARFRADASGGLRQTASQPSQTIAPDTSFMNQRGGGAHGQADSWGSFCRNSPRPTGRLPDAPVPNDQPL